MNILTKKEDNSYYNKKPGFIKPPGTEYDVLSPNVIQAPNFIVYQSGTSFIAINTSTGSVAGKSTNLASLISSLYTADRIWVHLKSGNYTITEPIKMYNFSGLRLTGCGMTTTQLNLAANSNCNMIEYYNSTGAIIYFAQVSDLTLAGNGANNASGHGIHCVQTAGTNPADMHIRNVFVNNCKQCGIYIEDGWGLHLHDCLTEYCKDVGVKALSNYQVFMNNIFSAYNLDGYYLASGNYLLNNLWSYMNDRRGFLLVGDYIQASNLFSKWDHQAAPVGYSIRLSGSDYSTIQGATIIRNESDIAEEGFTLDDCKSCNLVDCQDNGSVKSLYIKNDCEDISIQNFLGRGATVIDDNGVRTIINNISNNAGVPGVAGNWATATRTGVIVRDTTNHKTYIYAEAGWREISAL